MQVDDAAFRDRLVKYALTLRRKAAQQRDISNNDFFHRQAARACNQ